MTPRVSVLIPTYNRDEYLAECLDSILEQSLRPYEVIINKTGALAPERNNMEVTRQDFMSYEEVRLSGVTNMFDVKAVEAYSGLPREAILDIMEHYSAYRKWLYDGKYASMAHVINGTHGIGTILANYDDIVAVYGKPFTRLPENKIDVQWVIETKHGVATLYNYKDGKAYLGETIDYRVQVGDIEVRIQKGRRTPGPTVGESVGLSFPHAHWYPATA